MKVTVTYSIDGYEFDDVRVIEAVSDEGTLQQRIYYVRIIDGQKYMVWYPGNESRAAEADAAFKKIAVF